MYLSLHTGNPAQESRTRWGRLVLRSRVILDSWVGGTIVVTNICREGDQFGFLPWSHADARLTRCHPSSCQRAVRKARRATDSKKKGILQSSNTYSLFRALDCGPSVLGKGSGTDKRRPKLADEGYICRGWLLQLMTHRGLLKGLSDLQRAAKRPAGTRFGPFE